MTKFNEERTTIILDAIAKGVPHRFAAQKARIAEKTLYEWKNRGETEFKERNDTAYAKFYLDLLETEAIKVENALENIISQTNRWQASAWWLARRYPNIFGEHVDQIKEMNDRLLELEKFTQNNGLTEIEPKTI